jgi:hypothetical protein
MIADISVEMTEDFINNTEGRGESFVLMKGTIKGNDVVSEFQHGIYPPASKRFEAMNP